MSTDQYWNDINAVANLIINMSTDQYWNDINAVANLI